ncbi:hypothetical protein HZS55_15980 [Halosimplex rubrum]|uniref:Uncharacterized protein n=1 Tax=Halosimplex rubrum TaxID=869889 RepID=A0A7D5TDZ9_9EURY|nr:hypothetical protein [Halosimplex rubrum]QLH78696.1 hypothetical protein HZS55_15980 [Halosimplex rubrum]
MSDGVDVTAEDAIQVAQRALAKVGEQETRIDELEADLDDAVEDLTALKLRVSEEDADREYDSLTLDEKIGRVREHGFERASDGHGRTRLTYDDIMWEVFDGEPGANHCYKLMRRAAGETEAEQEDMEDGTPGFAVRDPDGSTRHLAVNADRAKRGAAFFPRNKTTSGEGRSG